MARISGRIRIAAPVERVFDTAADSRNEPSFNPAMTGVELLTPLPIGLGTRFRARMGKAGGEMLVELTEFERPHRLSSRTASSMMETTEGLTFAAEGDGTVMSWDWQVRPKGWMRMLGPLVGVLGSRNGAQDLDRAEAPARRRWKHSRHLTTDHRRDGPHDLPAPAANGLREQKHITRGRSGRSGARWPCITMQAVGRSEWPLLLSGLPSGSLS
jgi:uncharacterized protein YndB with AHSA1/START domain